MSILGRAALALALLGATSHAETRTAASVSYEDVSAAISAAGVNDTVLVPAGAAAWTRTLTITKGIVLKGSGIGSTTITNNTADHSPLIRYRPADYDANDPFRLTGFTFDLASNGAGLVLGISGKKAPFTVQTRIRIDHNRFANDSTGKHQAIWNYGGMYGVVDNNVFDGVVYPTRNAPQVGGSSWWDDFVYTFGAADQNLCYEDNTFTGVGIVADSQFSGRYAFRYNTITLGSDAYPLFDMHGNQPSGGRRGTAEGMYSTFGGEIYGNQINANGYGMCLLDQRGGKVLVFCNNVTTTKSVHTKLREEYPDSDEPTTSAQPQHVSKSYYWNNRANGVRLIPTAVPIGPSGTATGGGEDYLEDSRARFEEGYGRGVYGLLILSGKGAGQFGRIVRATQTRLTVTPTWTVTPDATSQYRVIGDCCNALAENREFFNQADLFDGSAGVGMGPLAARPATCTPGVAYWATDQTLADLPRMVGARPRMPITGTLFRCTAQDTWTAYYTPCPYPHPLRVAGPVADAQGPSQAGLQP